MWEEGVVLKQVPHLSFFWGDVHTIPKNERASERHGARIRRFKARQNAQ